MNPENNIDSNLQVKEDESTISKIQEDPKSLITKIDNRFKTKVILQNINFNRM